jgi:PhzF family phenazine biosynthesis protein
MKLPLYWIDAFTDRVFGGNPAAVIPLEAWLEPSLLQAIARENNLSETAFVVRTGPASAKLRWFTPKVEVDLCGHATLATAYALFHCLGWTGESVAFETASGLLTVTRRGDRLELDFPARPAAPAPASPELLKGLGAAPAFTARSQRMWLCVFETQAEVAALAPNAAFMEAVLPGRIIATAPGTDCDFVSRFFAPDAGIYEDPVTGSAHCTLMPYWAARLGRTALFARQISARGGALWCELRGDRVAMAGHGVLYLQGQLSL